MLFDPDIYKGPGRKKKLTAGSVSVIAALTLIMCGILVFSLRLAVYSRITVVRLDPYLKVSIQGADSYAKVVAEFDRESFAKELEGILSQLHPGKEMTAAELRQMSALAADSVFTEYTLEDSQDKSRDNSAASDDQEPSGADTVYGSGISNGDRVSCYAYMEEKAQELLREKGFVLAFESSMITQTAEGLPEAEPYDPFSDLTVEFEGKSGKGRVLLSYQGPFPLIFRAEPDRELKNGDMIRICMTPAEKYDIEQIAGEYHIVPTVSETSIEVRGLFFEPVSIHVFSDEMIDRLKEVGREKARALLEEEYNQDETIVSLSDAGLFFAARPDQTDEASDNHEDKEETEEITYKDTKDNYLFCAYLVHYADESGNQLEYYYYVRFENLLINDQNQLYTDFDQAVVPQKSTFLWRGLFGEDTSVSVPGIFNFRTLAGFETLQGLKEAITDDLDNLDSIGYGITEAT